MTPDYHFVHNRFKLNGFHLNEDDLCRIAYSFIKEGEPFEKAVGDFLLDWFDRMDYIEMQTSGTTGAPKMIRVDKQAKIIFIKMKTIQFETVVHKVVIRYHGLGINLVIMLFFLSVFHSILSIYTFY